MYFLPGADISHDQRQNVHDGRAVSHTWVSPLLVAISLGVSKWGVKTCIFCTIYLRCIIVAVL